ncbi:FG-GAP repeat domain-containing protein [Amycolatopsis sp. cg5]|uniref:FG-GAP repeat domain-containing protein n=1 Tax=Amycolatopsis sp. cg5 TaxID=3238802 RepID=UPI0035261CA1
MNLKKTILAAVTAACVLGFGSPAIAAVPAPPPGFADTPAAFPEQPGVGTRSVSAADVQASATISRDQVLLRAKSWVDVNVKYTQHGQYGNQYGTYRKDCSGFVSMAWGLSPSGMSSPTTVSLPNYGSWLGSLDDLKPGDAIDSVGGGHVVLFRSWTDGSHAVANVYEETSYTGVDGPDPGAIASQYSRAKLTNGGYRPLRYSGITDGGSNAAKDFNGNGLADIAALDPGDNLILFSGNGAGAVGWGGPMWPTGGQWAGYKQFTTGDFNGDGKSDVAAIDPGDNLIFFPGNGAGAVGWGGPMWPTGGQWAGYKKITSGDFNGDGRTDIAALDPGDNLILFPGNGAGAVTWGGPMWPTGGQWAGYKKITSGDFNGDGRSDIAALDPGDNLILFPGNGAGAVGWGGPMWPTGGQWAGYKQITAADYNGDGRADIAALDPGDNLILFPGNGSGSVGWGGPMWPTGGQWAGYKAIS